MSKDALLTIVEQQHTKTNHPGFRVGDTLRVRARITDVGGKERIQSFTGTCIARKGSGSAETITLHRHAYGSGMERVFFINSPLLVDIEVMRKGEVRRSKLYYLRGTSGKATKVRERFGIAEEGGAQADEAASQSEEALPEASSQA